MKLSKGGTALRKIRAVQKKEEKTWMGVSKNVKGVGILRVLVKIRPTLEAVAL